ncbi:ionotropic receptor 75a-like [Anopheles albimanus]|uniref:ionotropic receptor 75a-like n=1 Tax=Anopheles albimanus TaxID=7167 RepID=UPI00163FBD28|nr:ionotropic receptor 75a-like [Anopheles albimanus]
MDTIYGRVYYTEAQDPEVKELFLKKIKPYGEKSFIEADEGIARVKNGLFAFEAEENAAYKLVKETFEQHDICKLQELSAINLPPFGIPIVKGSKYREIFRQRLMWQREVGIIKRFNIIWIHRKPQCEFSNAGYTSVGLIEMRYLFIFLALGMFVSLVVVVAERTWYTQIAVRIFTL